MAGSNSDSVFYTRKSAGANFENWPWPHPNATSVEQSSDFGPPAYNKSMASPDDRGRILTASRQHRFSSQNGTLYEPKLSLNDICVLFFQ